MTKYFNITFTHLYYTLSFSFFFGVQAIIIIPSEALIIQFNKFVSLYLDDSYSTFHRVDADPIAKYLQEPLYFEVELMKSRNPKVSLALVYCWATEDERPSLPKWDLIING